MRLLLTTIALLGACAHRTGGSIVLEDKVVTDPGGGGTGCPWASIAEVRLDPETVWVDERPYPVGESAGEQGFLTLVNRCGRGAAVPAFHAWRKAEEKAHEAHASRDSLATIGAVSVAGAVEAAAGGASAGNDALAHAIRDQNLQPIDSPAARPVDDALQQARDAFVHALRDPPAPPPED